MLHSVVFHQVVQLPRNSSILYFSYFLVHLVCLLNFFSVHFVLSFARLDGKCKYSLLSNTKFCKAGLLLLSPFIIYSVIPLFGLYILHFFAIVCLLIH